MCDYFLQYPLVRVKGPPIMVESGTPGMRGGLGGNAMVPGDAAAATGNQDQGKANINDTNNNDNNNKHNNHTHKNQN